VKLQAVPEDTKNTHDWPQEVRRFRVPMRLPEFLNGVGGRSYCEALLRVLVETTSCRLMAPRHLDTHSSAVGARSVRLMPADRASAGESDAAVQVLWSVS